MSVDGTRFPGGKAALLLALLLPVLIFLAAGALSMGASAQESASNANRQFVQAMQMIQQANSTFDSGEESRLLRDADRLLTEIVQRYPTAPSPSSSSPTSSSAISTSSSSATGFAR
jgi:hypothetical protein